ncbi:hypothetical protein KZZ52_16510 [Dactylosporangium sp. AC04546]|uniref:hypothetical protein n=1 Tax=Dactylosporangium sp. AC04546 TaxID=2862460 RepID=UPI001EDEB598|nr:hypothetical protein [Dactylosporangium sp. AC04546]WVK86903.1 hypothetical protein KZZ52_16510 [Dactylosporangium sp. AC04546]
MSSGERDVADADSRTSTPRSKVGGRRAWLFLGLALVVLAGGGPIAYVGRDDDPWVTSARSLFPAVDPLAAAAETGLYAANPPVGDVIVLADRSTQEGVPQRLRFSLVLWYSPNGKLCEAFVRQAAGNDSVCSYVNVDGSPKLADIPGLVPFCHGYWAGYLWVLGSVPPAVTSVTAVNGAGQTRTAKVVNVRAGTDGQFQLFTMMLYAGDVNLGVVRFDGTDESGRVVVTKKTDGGGNPI